MTGPNAFVLREFDCGGCEEKFVTLAGKVKILIVGGVGHPVCDTCADEINEIRVGHGQRPLWEGDK